MATDIVPISEVTVDLLHDLSRRLDSVWRYDQYIGNCDGDIELCEYWRAAQAQESSNIEQLKGLLTARVASGRF